MESPPKLEPEIRDAKTAVEGTIKILTQKVYRLPSSHAIKAYKILVNHLDLHYKDPKNIFHDVSTIRYLVHTENSDCGTHFTAIT